jgi:hypothetical protein
MRFVLQRGSSTFLVCKKHRLNKEIDLQSLFGLLCTTVLTPQLPPPPRIWAHIRGCYWSAKIDVISLYTLGKKGPSNEVN